MWARAIVRGSRVAIRRQHLDSPAADLQQRYVERAAADVEDTDQLVIDRSECAIGERGGDGLR